MRELENRQKFRRRIYSLPALAVLLVVAIMLVKGAYSIMITERQSSKDARLLALEVAALADRQKVLEAEIEKLNTDEGVEEEIKSKYNVARAGERVAVIVDRPERDASTTPEDDPWWRGIWNAIIGRPK